MAKSTDAGCTSYSERWVNIFFTGDTVCCKLCPLLQTYSRPQCMRTGELLPTTESVGYWCPLLKADEEGKIVNPGTGEVIFT